MLLTAVGEDKSLQCSANLFPGLSELCAGQRPPCRHAVGRCKGAYPSGVEYFVINFGAVALVYHLIMTFFLFNFAPYNIGFSTTFL
jgi:hypothetical protein